MFIEFILFIAVILFIFHYWIRCSKQAKLIDKLPGPYAFPIVGNMPKFFVKNEDIWPTLLKLNEQYYPLYRFWGPHLAVANLLHPDDIEALLTSSKHIEKSIIYKFIEDWLKKGLLTSTGNKWQNRRKILTPAFHFNILMKYVEVMLEHGARLVDELNSENNDVEIKDLEYFLSKYTLSAICETAMGVSFQNIDSGEVEKYRKAVYYMGESAVHRLVRPWLLPNWVFHNFTKIGWHQSKVVKILHNFSKKIIKERTEYHNQTNGIYLKENSSADGGEHIVKKKRLAMLDLLIAASKDGLIDDAGIQEEVDTFIFEGHDTSAMALCHAIQLLGEYKECQNKARAEVDEVWESCDGKITMTELNKLHYLDRCIKEALRLYPSVPFISRRLRENLHLKNAIIPHDTIVHVYIYDLHRDSRLWPEPIKFDPDRFLPEHTLNRHPYSYIPFSAGPRNCIGQKFAMLELKTFCAYILRNFYIETETRNEEFVLKPDLIIRGEKPIHAKFIPIQKEESNHVA